VSKEIAKFLKKNKAADDSLREKIENTVNELLSDDYEEYIGDIECGIEHAVGHLCINPLQMSGFLIREGIRKSVK